MCVPRDDLSVGPEDSVLEPRRAEGEPGDQQLVPTGTDQSQLEERVKGEQVPEELLCCICKGVLDKPYQSTGCGHLYCFSCVTQWLNGKETSPIDIHFSMLKTCNLPQE